MTTAVPAGKLPPVTQHDLGKWSYPRLVRRDAVARGTVLDSERTRSNGQGCGSHGRSGPWRGFLPAWTALARVMAPLDPQHTALGAAFVALQETKPGGAEHC